MVFVGLNQTAKGGRFRSVSIRSDGSVFVFVVLVLSAPFGLLAQPRATTASTPKVEDQAVLDEDELERVEMLLGFAFCLCISQYFVSSTWEHKECFQQRVCRCERMITNIGVRFEESPSKKSVEADICMQFDIEVTLERTSFLSQLQSLACDKPWIQPSSFDTSENMR